MKIKIPFLARKKAALCILAGVCAVSLFVIITSQNRVYQNSGGAYAVKIKHYGIDAAEMERSVTIPLEDALFSIPGVISMQSSSESSLSIVYIRFRSGAKGNYEAVRDAAQRVYETLPSSAQRPEILSSNNSRIPVWSASFIAENSENTSFLLEKIVKPRFESLEGAGEILISGAGLKEIYIILDQEKLSVLGLEPSFIASYLGMNDSIFSGGTIAQGSKEIIVTVDGRYPSPEKALIPVGDGKFIELSDIAIITEQEREPDIYSRLNGKKTASIAVMSRYGADLRKLSSDIKKEIKSLSLPAEFTVLSDHGAEESAAFKSVLNAALLGAIMVALISLLLNRKNNVNFSGFFCALAIPIICLISIAVLSIVGFSPDRLLLAGIAAGIGTAIDAVILCSEKLRKCACYKSASVLLSSLKGPLIAGSATTVVALIPLFSIEDTNVKIIAIAIAIVSMTSLILSLSLLPPLLLWNFDNNSDLFKTPIKIKRIGLTIFRKACRFLAGAVRFCNRYPAFILIIYACITVIAFLLLFAKGVDTSRYSSENSIFAQVEFNSGLLAEETDRLLAKYSEQLKNFNGVKNVETGAKIGSGTLLVSFDPKQTKAHNVKEAAKNIFIPGGFIFFHESSARERYWEINIYGEEEKKCREFAEILVHLYSDHPLIKERVLNFKQGSKKLILLPDREVFTEAKISFTDAASRARLGVYGPVAYKRIDASGETDVRIKTSSIKTAHNVYGDDFIYRQSREETLGLLVSISNKEVPSYIPIDSLMRIKEETEPSSIKRNNKRRTASITITTKPMDPQRAKKEFSSIFKMLELPPGYSVEFDPEAIRQSEKLTASIFSLILAIIFCYMIIASINESFFIPFFILSAIPPSLAIPAIFLVLTGVSYNLAVACAFIVVSGMTVNASILCVDSIKTIKTSASLNIYSALRQKLPALLATSGTTIAGAIPFLFLTEGANILIRTLSLVSAIGVACSCICSITLIPSLFSFSDKILRLCRVKKQTRSII